MGIYDLPVIQVLAKVSPAIKALPTYAAAIKILVLFWKLATLDNIVNDSPPGFCSSCTAPVSGTCDMVRFLAIEAIRPNFDLAAGFLGSS